MTFQVLEADRLSIDQMREFLRGIRQIEFQLEGKAAVYGVLERVLQHQHYGQLGKGERGVILSLSAQRDDVVVRAICSSIADAVFFAGVDVDDRARSDLGCLPGNRHFKRALSHDD
jgi:hypothetical protein